MLRELLARLEPKLAVDLVETLAFLGLAAFSVLCFAIYNIVDDWPRRK